jgi:diguanylate cyclase (GGDEF)-like protein
MAISIQNLRRGRRRQVAVAAIALVAVLGAIAFGIARSHQDTKAQIEKNFRARGAASAEFVSSFVSQQAAREALTAKKFLAGHRRLASEFDRTVATFGSSAAVLLDSSGRLIEIEPDAPALLGSKIAPKYAHLTAAEGGHAAVSGVVPSAARHEAVIAIAVPFQTAAGRRVFSAAYPVSKTNLASFVEHVIATKPHLVLLVDAKGNMIAGNPSARAKTLRERAPNLANALGTAREGSVTLIGRRSTFLSTPVAGTTWRLVIAVPNSKLFASVTGPAQWLPWIVFALIALLAAVVLGLLSRSIVAHDRLKIASAKLAKAARTDALTGLANRRSLQERIPQLWAYANRHQEPLAVLMIDFDHFKLVNDTYGHDTGDALLCEVAECMNAVFRGGDLFGRWGGDEFLAILGSTDEDGAKLAAERLSASVALIDIGRYGLYEPIRLSIGCASGTGVPAEDLISQADDALYRAKREGRRHARRRQLFPRRASMEVTHHPLGLRL